MPGPPPVYGEHDGASRMKAAPMAAELREDPGHVFVVDVECGLEEDWGDDRVGAGVRVDEHNEAAHPKTAAGVLGSPEL